MSWKRNKIKNFADLITGGTPSTIKREYWDGGDIPWLNSGELNQKIITYSTNFITEKGLKESNAKMMPAGSVLIALTGATTGVTGFLTFEACANQSVTGILPSKNHHSKFLYYYLSSIRDKILNDSYGGAQKHISQAYVKEIEVPLPSLSIQQRIAAILDKADELRRKDKALLAQYDKLLQSIFYQMFRNRATNNNGWRSEKLSKLCTIITDGTHQSPKFYDNGVPFLLVSNIVNNEITYDTNKFISREDYISLVKRTPIEIGDILMTTVGSYGNPAIVENRKEFCFQRHIAYLKPKHSEINYKYLFGALKSDEIRKQIDASVRGVAQKTLNLFDLRNLVIPCPPMNLQQKYSIIIDNIRIQKQLIHQQISHSENLFQSLLQKAFKGELIK